MLEMKVRKKNVVVLSKPLRIPPVICPERRTSVFVGRRTDELLCDGCKWVSRFEMLYVLTK